MRREPQDKQRDAERTKQRIVDAAVEEFAAKGFAGARVSAIANRAGVNKQLISYYFGGKEGLYRELTSQWQSTESGFADPSLSLAELVGGYVRANAANPAFGKLLVWEGLRDGEPTPEFVDDMRRNIEGLRERQRKGELPASLDPAAMLVALFAIAAAGVAFPQIVRAVFDEEPASAEFAERYATQIEQLLSRLAEG
ncbi:TetR/AcrR family transcriptional regulator [Nonomuraea africana]|uniref:AcrR family transcriptional regulator n=1 Tax=Nonomuraea africana TaxID=46171 RepID=A0ABR9K8D1_9ACTN|nr:TetR/AcrR family transcriptional regulator [Nonomuraea africana]MBE1557832.1 AcrR family transcriptional regulator [Nonomuraea africana]